MGRVVVTASSSYYADLGFVFHGRTAEEYCRVLDDAAAGRLEVTPEMQEKALLCYYTAQVCNWVHSSFNPEAFKVWSQSPLEVWYEEPATARVLDAILGGVAAPVVNHAAQAQAQPQQLAPQQQLQQQLQLQQHQQHHQRRWRPRSMDRTLQLRHNRNQFKRLLFD